MRKKKIIALALLFVMLTSALAPFIYKDEAYASGRMIISLNPETDIKVGQEFAVYLTARNSDNENTTASMKLTFDPALISYISSNASDASCNGNVITATGKSVRFNFKAVAEGTVSLVARATAGGTDLESAGIRVTIIPGENQDDNNGGDDGNDDGDDSNGDDTNGEDDNIDEEPEEPVIIDVKDTDEYKQLQENYSKLYDRYNLLKNDKRRFFIMTIAFGALAVILLIIIIIILISRRSSDDYDDYDDYDKSDKKEQSDRQTRKQQEAALAEQDRLRQEAIARDLAAREAKMHAREEKTPVREDNAYNDYLEKTASKSEQADVDIAKHVASIIAQRTSKLASPDQVEGLVKEDINPTPAKMKTRPKNSDEDDLFLMDIDDL